MSVIKPALQHPARIAYLTGASNYTWLHFNDGEKTMLAKSINYFESLLSDFVRVHKTALVNPAYVEKLEEPPRRRMAGQVCLVGGVTLPVSRRRWDEVTDLLQPYLKSGQEEKQAVSAQTGKSPVVSPARDQEEPMMVVLATDDAPAAEKLRQLVDTMGSEYLYRLHIAARSSHLPDVFRLLPYKEQPVLILLDARSATAERLLTLRNLKENNRSSFIPVIMLVTPTSTIVSDAYTHRANSVVTVPADRDKFVMVMERVCQYWLKRSSLPTTN